MSSRVRQSSNKRTSRTQQLSRAKAAKLSKRASRATSPTIVSSPGSSAESANTAVLGAEYETFTSHQRCEEAALLAVKTQNEISFARIVLGSPSPYSLKLGVLYAAKFNWCQALHALLPEIQASHFRPEEIDSLGEHPMFNDYFEKYSGCGFSSNLKSETTFEELAFMKTVIDGYVDAVNVFLQFIDPNFGDMFGRPFLSYVYKNKNEASRRRCLDLVLPKLELSDAMLAIPAEHGDLQSVKYLVDKMKSTGNFVYFTAVRRSIIHGHDEVAKWIISQPNLIDWRTYRTPVIAYATEKQDYELLAFISQNVPNVGVYSLGSDLTETLWRLLKNKDTALFKKFVPEHKKYLHTS